MLSALAAAAALGRSEINLDQVFFGASESLAVVSQQEERGSQSGGTLSTAESIEDLIRRASPIAGVPDRQKLEGRYNEIESRTLVQGPHTYVLDPRPRFSALNVSSYAASSDGRYLAIAQLVRLDQEELVGGAVPTYRLDLSVLDRTTNKLTPLRLPAQTVQSDLDSPQAIERTILNDVAFFSGPESRGRLLVLLITRSDTNKGPQRIAWGASPDGSCVEIGPLGWKEEITLSPNAALGIDYSVDKQSHRTQRTIFSPDRILQREVIDGEVFPFGWTSNGQAIEGSSQSGQPHRWWTLDLKNSALTSKVATERPKDATPQEPLFANLALAAQGGVLKLNTTSNSVGIRFDHEFDTSTVLPAIGKTPIQVFGVVKDGSAFLSSVFDVSTALFQQRLLALKEREQLEIRAQELSGALKKIVNDNNGLPNSKDLINALSAQGVSLEGFKALYETPNNMPTNSPIAEMRGQHWVAFFPLNGSPYFERVNQ